MLPKLSVARTEKVVVVLVETSVGIPLTTPVVEFNTRLVGSVPANNVYVILVAGLTGVADNRNAILIPYGYVPIEDPEGVFQIGCDILAL